MTTYYAVTVDSPVGPLVGLVDSAGAVVRIELPGGRTREELEGDLHRRGITLAEDPERTRELVRQLGEYFAGERRQFDLPLAAAGTPFQRAVWSELSRIPFGETRSYGEVARALGKPGASRAVGRANGANPIPIVVPCHRVLGADGSLTGFGGGLEAKAALLALEGRGSRRLFD